MSNLLDTIMNIEVFAFIGLLVWLYFKPSPPDDGEPGRPDIGRRIAKLREVPPRRRRPRKARPPEKG